MKSNQSISIISLLVAITLLSCSGGGKVDNPQFAFFNDLDISIDKSLLLGDTLTLPDIYCGDSEQTTDDLKGHRLSHGQYEKLIVPAGRQFADEMSNWMLLGTRDMGNGVTLAA
ncbi:MAG: hypothetical protein IJV05_04345, partial [Muribaculaceae bacterium]|nr:hypothetical protein [Muribaculaceae bacterium]